MDPVGIGSVGSSSDGGWWGCRRDRVRKGLQLCPLRNKHFLHAFYLLLPRRHGRFRLPLASLKRFLTLFKADLALLKTQLSL